MNFDFEECRRLLLGAVLAELEAVKSTIFKIPGYEAGSSELRTQVSAICMVVAPWHRGFDLGLRDDGGKWDKTSIGDWKLYPLCGAGPWSTTQGMAVVEYFGREYGRIENPKIAREIAHLMCLAAAEALLDHSVTTLLRQYQIDAPYVDDTFLPHRCFEYIVEDPDNSISANYCEIVIANRITKRLKMSLEQFND